MSETHEGNVLTTYRSLRVAMIPLLLILVVAPALETMRGQVCVLGSISAYFHTPVRGAFVFALAGLGACLIAYKGNDPVEDVLLNFAGFMAFLVALVPTTVDMTCVAKYGNVVADTNTADAVRNNVLTLILMSFVAICLYRLMPKLVAAAKKRRGFPLVTPVPLTLSEDDKNALKLAPILGSLALVIVIVELALFGFWPSTFKDYAHGISAITMVVGVLGVMVANARGFARATRGMDNPPAKHWNNRYAAAAAATLALIGLAILLMYSSQHLILVIELIVIMGFVVFWFMQTRELWDYPTREQKSQKVDQVMEEAGGEQELEPEVAEESAPTPQPEVVAEEPTSTSQPEVPALTETPMSRGEVYKAM
jgi:hypothetical protein